MFYLNCKTYDFHYLIYSTEFTEIMAHINLDTVQFAQQNRTRADPVSLQNTKATFFCLFVCFLQRLVVWRSFDNKTLSIVNFVLKVVKLHFSTTF